MKRILIPFLFLAAACSQPPKDHFVLRGTVPGAMDSTEVVLTPIGETWNAIARGYVLGERFELQGKLPYPTCFRLAVMSSANALNCKANCLIPPVAAVL